MNTNSGITGTGTQQAAVGKKKPNFLKYGLIALAVIVVAVAAWQIWSGINGNYVATVNGEKVGKGEFNYYLYVQKANMLSDAQSADSSIDEETFWKTPINGEDANEVAKTKALDSVREMKIQLSKAKEAGIELTSDEKKSIDEWIQTNIIDSEDIGGGNRAKADKQLKTTYGISINELQTLQQEIAMISDFQTAEAKKMDTTIETFYNANKDLYVTSSMRADGGEAVWARHILIKAAKDTATADELAAAKSKAEELLAKVKAGEDFATLAAANSEDSNASTGGSYVFGKDVMVSEFQDAAFSIGTGAANAVIVQTSFGFHVIMVEEKYAKDEPVSLKCATEYTDYGTSFVQKNLYSKLLDEWKSDAKYDLKINQSVYKAIK
ncbi:MAG: hypothetical protein HGA22_04950 [Clostridiales bacterium]|nr:hypothetical protein [Clostridiales bacterium]